MKKTLLLVFLALIGLPGFSANHKIGTIAIIKDFSKNDKKGVKFTVDRAVVRGKKGRRIHFGFNIKQDGRWLSWHGLRVRTAKYNTAVFRKFWFFYSYDELKEKGADLTKPMSGYFYIMDSAAKTSLLYKGIDFSLSGAFAGDLLEKLKAQFRDNNWTGAVLTATRMIQKTPQDAKLYLARGMANYEARFFEQADRDFEKARSLGLADSASWTSSHNRLNEYREWNKNALRLYPLRFRYPDDPDAYIIGVRYYTDGRYAQSAIKAAAKTAALLEKFFGCRPKRIMVFAVTKKHVSDSWKATRVSLGGSLLDRSAFALGSHHLLLYEDRLGSNSTDFSRQSTVAHECAHVMESQLLGVEKGRDEWWMEGIATYFEHNFGGVSETQALAKWTRHYKYTNSITQSGLFQSFQFDGRASLHYATANMMMRHLIKTRGREFILKVLEKMRGDMDFNAALKDVTGMTPEMFYNDYIPQLKKQAGITYTGPQVRPAGRKQFKVGDWMLIRSKYAGQNLWEPAYWMKGTGDRITVRFGWGGQKTVSLSRDTKNLDWKPGTNILAKDDTDALKPAVITGFDDENVQVRFSDGKEGRVSLSRCWGKE